MDNAKKMIPEGDVSDNSYPPWVTETDGTIKKTELGENVMNGINNLSQEIKDEFDNTIKPMLDALIQLDDSSPTEYRRLFPTLSDLAVGTDLTQTRTTIDANILTITKTVKFLTSHNKSLMKNPISVEMWNRQEKGNKGNWGAQENKIAYIATEMKNIMDNFLELVNTVSHDYANISMESRENEKIKIIGQMLDKIKARKKKLPDDKGDGALSLLIYYYIKRYAEVLPEAFSKSPNNFNIVKPEFKTMFPTAPTGGKKRKNSSKKRKRILKHKTIKRKLKKRILKKKFIK